MGSFLSIIGVIVFILIITLAVVYVLIGVEEFVTFAVIAPIVIIVLLIIGLYNNLVRLRQNVRREKRGIDVYLKQRFDLIPNLVETVKGHKEYENEVLTKITNIRAEYLADKDNTSKNNDLNTRFEQVMALVENYPELKADESFLNLQKTLAKLEAQLQAARRLYNMAVTEYNVAIQKFPNVIFARVFGFAEEELFVIEDNERENISVDM